MKSTIGFLLCISALGLVVAAAAPAPVTSEFASSAPSVAVQYAEVQSIFDAKCVSCHTGSDAARGLSLNSWKGTFAGSDHGEAVIAYDAARSLLIELTTKLVGGPHPTELDAEGLTEDEVTLLSVWIDEGARSTAGEIPFAEAVQLLYAANQSEAVVSVIDMETNQVVRTVDLQPLGLPANAWPHHIAVEPDGSYWYLSLIASNQILKFDRQNQLIERIDFVRPGLLALDPVGENLYAARSMAAVSPPQEIGVIRRSDMSFEEVGIFLPRPHALAVQPGTGTVFTASLAVNQIASFYPEDEALELADLGGVRPHTFIGFAISPDGRWMVGTTELTASVFVFDLERTDMIPVDTIAVNAAPWHPVFTPDGRWVYVGNNWDNTANVIDMETRTLAKVIEGNGLAQPHGSATSPDGRFAYIASRNLEMPPGHSKYEHMYTPRYDTGDNARAGTVVVIDTSTQEIVKVIEIEGYGAGLGTAALMP